MTTKEGATLRQDGFYEAYVDDVVEIYLGPLITASSLSCNEPQAKSWP